MTTKTSTRGALEADEQNRIKVFKTASPSVVNITSLLAVLFIMTSVLLGCAAQHPAYVVGRDGELLSRSKAMQALIGETVVPQLKSPLDQPLKVLQASLPDYPPELRHAEGVVRLTFFINGDGSVSDPRVLGNPDPALAGLCVQAVMHWRFAPISRDGKPTKERFGFEFIFRLKD